MTGSLVTVCLVVLGLSVIGSSKAVEEWKAILAWTQIALFAVAAYGGQLMFRNPGQATEVWFAFPPDWVHWLPPAWLARFVDEACLAPRLELLGIAAGMLVGTAILVAITLRQISAMYETMQPVEVSRHERIMPPEAVGVLPGPNWFRRSFSTEFRIGCWLSWRALRQNAAHRMRCLYPVNLAVAVTLLGPLTDQFANPLTTPVAVGGEFDAAGRPSCHCSPSISSLSVPVVLLNLTFSEWNGASWLLTSAPLRRPAAVTHGAIAIVQLLIVTPLCLLLWLCMFASWGDVVAATAHAGLAWLLSIPAALASVWVVIPDLPLTRPASRGGTLGTRRPAAVRTQLRSLGDRRPALRLCRFCRFLDRSPGSDRRSDARDGRGSATSVRTALRRVAMISMKQSRRWLKTARGQLLLFAAVYCGAIVMAVGSLILKPVLFEPYIQHRLPTMSDELTAKVEAIASGTASADQLKGLSSNSLTAAYGGLINNEFSDPEGRVISGLVRFRSEEVLGRLQTTVATGTIDQRQQAIRLLKASRSADRSQAIRLTRSLFDRALRMGDQEIRQAAESAHPDTHL